MLNYQTVVIILFVVAAFISVLVTALDKLFAIRQMRRISERNLLMIAVFGSAVSMYITMRIIRHKTRHNKFMLGLPLIIFLKLLVLLFIYFKFL